MADRYVVEKRPFGAWLVVDTATGVERRAFRTKDGAVNYAAQLNAYPQVQPPAPNRGAA